MCSSQSPPLNSIPTQLFAPWHNVRHCSSDVLFSFVKELSPLLNVRQYPFPILIISVAVRDLFGTSVSAEVMVAVVVVVPVGAAVCEAVGGAVGGAVGAATTRTTFEMVALSA